ncbi:MAG: hypothetical protein ABJD97_00605 [Betaproteobacteria bacterium]
MTDELRERFFWTRALALVAVTSAGFLTIVGSGGGGGSVGFPPCPPSVCVPAPPPAASAVITPAYVTAQVGTSPSWSVTSSNITGAVTYLWRRSSDGGATYAVIAGATASSYTLAGVNLADDGALIEADVVHSGEVVSAVSRLLVSATPGIVFEDTEFAAADWVVTPLLDATHTVFAPVTEQVASGGNPGAYRKMTFTIEPLELDERAIFVSQAFTYDPAAQGAIRVIDYAEDCRALQDSSVESTQSSLVIEQAGRHYGADQYGLCVQTSWAPVANRASLVAADFHRFDGPACGTGESCPDFSAAGAPMRFGYFRIVFGTQGNVIAHGIDNWKVTVWRQ